MFSRKRTTPGQAVNTDDEFNALHYSLYQMCGMDDTVYNYYDKRSQCLPRPLSAVLVNIRDFAGPGKHYEGISGIIQGMDEDIFQACIKDLHESGLLITKNEALAKLRANERVAPPGSISAAAWITRDRHDSLVRSIESFAANFRAYGHTLDCFVSDDSTDEGASARLSARLEGLAEKEGLSVTHMGRGERRRLRDAILDRAKPDGLPPAVIDFALFGAAGPHPSYGANRNAMLLANAGRMFLFSDDDVFCDLRIPENDGYDFELTSFNKLDFRDTFPDRSTLVSSHPAGKGDILSFHSKLLGRHTSGILEDFPDNGRIKVSKLEPELLTRLLDGGGNVRATITGVLGDSGLTTPRYQLFLRDGDRERHTVSEQTFRELLLSKEVYQSSSHFTVGSKSLFWGMNIGIDNRSISPPFLPVLRGEDYVFYTLLRCAEDTALVGSLPVAIFHDPVDQRTYPEQAAFKPRPEVCDLLTLLLNDIQFIPGTDAPGDRLYLVGKHLADIASLPLDEFDGFIRQQWLKLGMHATITIENLLREYDHKPAFWADYLEKYIISIRDHGYVRYITATRDLYAGDERAAAEECRNIIRQFGELLKWWPAIFAAALDIRGNSR